MQGLMMSDGSLRYVNNKEDFAQLIQEFMGSDCAEYYMEHSNYKIEELERAVRNVRMVFNMEYEEEQGGDLDDAIDALEGVVYG